jgi:hypothetical protein
LSVERAVRNETLEPVEQSRVGRQGQHCCASISGSPLAFGLAHCPQRGAQRN